MKILIVLAWRGVCSNASLSPPIKKAPDPAILGELAAGFFLSLGPDDQGPAQAKKLVS